MRNDTVLIVLLLVAIALIGVSVYQGFFPSCIHYMEFARDDSLTALRYWQADSDSFEVEYYLRLGASHAQQAIDCRRGS